MEKGRRTTKSISSDAKKWKSKRLEDLAKQERGSKKAKKAKKAKVIHITEEDDDEEDDD